MPTRVAHPGNLTDEGQARRLRMGIVVGTLAMTLAFVVLALELPLYWRLFLFVPFALAASGVAQGLCKT